MRYNKLEIKSTKQVFTYVQYTFGSGKGFDRSATQKRRRKIGEKWLAGDGVMGAFQHT